MGLQLNLSTTATFGTEESGHCRQVLSKSQCMDFFCPRDERNSGCCREVAVSGGTTV